MRIKRPEYGFILLIAILLHIFLVDYLSFFILVFVLLMPFVSLLLMVLGSSFISVQLDIDHVVLQKEEEFVLRLLGRNAFFLPCHIRISLKIKNELTKEEETRWYFLHLGKEEQRIEQSISTRYCGAIFCQIEEIRVYDSLGFLHRKKKAKNQALPVYVYVLPTEYSLPNSNKVQFAEVSAQRNWEEDPGEIEEFREYREGDSLTKIHWKLSDKLDRMIVKEYGLIDSNELLLLVDLKGKKEELDGVLDVLHSLSQNLLQNQVRFDIEWYDRVQKTLCRNSIIDWEEYDSFLNNILSFGGSLKDQMVFHSATYSDVMYLCTEIIPDTASFLQESMPESRIHSIVISDRIQDLKENIALLEEIGVEVTFLELGNLKHSFSGFVLSM